MNESINQSINDEAVYRTAPATPGLLMSWWSYIKDGLNGATQYIYLCIYERKIFVIFYYNVVNNWSKFKSWKVMRSQVFQTTHGKRQFVLHNQIKFM